MTDAGIISYITIMEPCTLERLGADVGLCNIICGFLLYFVEHNFVSIHNVSQGNVTN